jgi:hypothetical protein
LNQRRFETLFHVEETLRPDDDYGYLIVPACQILEPELDRLFIESAGGIAKSLIAALQVTKKDRPIADSIEKWADDQVPTTIGIGSLVLLALRRWVEHRLNSVLEFLETHFKPDFARLLASKQLGRCLDAIRNRYRNPACHGKDSFDSEDYGEFARLVIANERFAAWDAAGPDPIEPAMGFGILHHHLHHTRLIVREPSDVSHGSLSNHQPDSIHPPDQDTLPIPAGLRLVASLEVGANRFLKLATAQSPCDASAVTLGRISGSPGPISVRTGDRVRIEVVVEREGYVTVFAIGPTGHLSLLYPDDPPSTTPPTQAQAHRLFHVADVVLTPPTGRERLFAVWNCEPLSLHPEQFHRLAESGEVAGFQPSRPSRDMKRLPSPFNHMDPRESCIVFLELDQYA